MRRVFVCGGLPGRRYSPACSMANVPTCNNRKHDVNTSARTGNNRCLGGNTKPIQLI